LLLGELWKSLGCSGEEDLESALIHEVSVLVEDNAWRLVLVVEQPVPAARLNSISQELLNQVASLKAVQIITQPQDPASCLSAIVSKDWSQIITELDEGDRALLDECTCQIENDHLVLMFKDYPSWQQAVERNICGQIEDWIFRTYQMSLLVSAQHEIHQEPPGMVERKVNSEDNILPSQPFKRRNKESRRSRSKGRPTDTPPMPIKELQEGLDRVAVEGLIFNKKTRQLKDGRQVTTYDITDFSDSITVKRFDEDTFDTGITIKVWGGVRYDSFEKDLVLFADHMEAVELAGRTDNSPTKRVELHLHTTMSTMDGLTHVGDLMKRAASFGHKAVAITDHGSIQAFPQADEAGRKLGIKVIYGVEAYLVDQPKQDHPYHIILLAASQEGLGNLYKLVSSSYLNNFYRTPRILRSELLALREGILVGSACESGEIIRSIVEGKDQAELLQMAGFYDYLEIQPLGNNEFLVRDGIMGNRQDLISINRRVLELGRILKKPVVATGDVHFLDPEHDTFRRIIQAGKGFTDAENQAPLFYRTTEEMLSEFSYLGEDLAWEVVVTNPNAIADRCQELRPVPDGYFAPMMEGAAERLTSMAWETARALYKEPLPSLVEERLTRELHSITKHGFSELYLIAHELVKKSNSDGYLVGSRGSVGSSLTAFLTGITEVNPLAPHYRCRCGFSRFVEDGSVHSGVDLPRAICPECGQEMQRDGFDIPFETFLGFEGDKVPDIDLNFSGDYQSRAHQFVEELFGKDHVFRAGTISTIAEKTAYGFVKKYEEEMGLRFRRAEIDRLVRGITGVKRTTGQHPGGLMIIPGHMNVHQFTPVQHPADDMKSGVTTTHFEYEALSGALVKLDVLGHDDPTMIKSLEDLTGFKATQVSLDEPMTMGLFSGVESLGVKPEDIRSQVGTYGIPEFNTRFVRQMLEVTRPRTFSELIRISGLSHGTNVWLNNAQDLIKNKTAGLGEVIATRDDIMIYLIQKGLGKKDSFKIMEKVRKGKGLSGDEVEAMKANNVPQWYIDSCNRIEYMFPKAHAVAYVMMAYRIAYYKVYYPLAFYSSYFSIRAQDFDEVIMIGPDAVRQRLEEIEAMGQQAPTKDKNLIPVLEVALEMWVRGYRFYPVDLYRSDASRFVIVPDGLLVPFSALPGVGLAAAHNLVEGRGDGSFTSLEDLQRRGRVNKTVMDILEKSGCLKDLPPTDQLSLFA
jgi:DNA polymerase-3 subunit alpha (Gram-positive type)